MKKTRFIGLFAVCAVGALALSSCTKEVKTPELEGYSILWSDEFNGTALDDSIWNREVREAGWTNNELQAYVTDEANGFVRDGKFVIKGIEHQDGTYTSCKLNTRGKQDFMYGKVCVSAKVPEGKGLWPAIWMMPKDESVYGQWPKCGEIDIMEVLGDHVEKTYGTIHYGEPHAEQQESVTLTDGKTFASDFHEYAIEWEPGEIKWFLDGEEFFSVNDWFTAVEGEDDKPYPAPFNQLFSLQINLAIGGNWPGNPEKGASYMDKAEFEIDYVRVYQKPDYNPFVNKPFKNYRNPDETGNYINNSDFSDATEDLTDTKDWQFYKDKGGVGTAVIADGKVAITPTNTGTEDYAIQFMHNNIPFFKNKTYRITFDIWASEARTVNEICVDAPNAGWQRYWKINDLAITTTQTTYTYEFTMTAKDDNSARFEFNLGNNPSLATVYITNVRLEVVE